MKDKQSLLNLIMEIIQELKRYHLEKDSGMQYFSKHDFNLDRREVADYGGYQDEQRVGKLQSFFFPLGCLGEWGSASGY